MGQNPFQEKTYFAVMKPRHSEEDEDVLLRGDDTHLDGAREAEEDEDVLRGATEVEAR